MMRAALALLIFAASLLARPALAVQYTVADRETAWAQCRADAVGRPPNGLHTVQCTENGSFNPGAGYGAVGDCLTNSPYNETASCWATHYNSWRWPSANNGCPAGTTWNATTKTCYSAAKCLAKAPQGIGILNVGQFGDKMCSGGCEFQAQGGTTSTLVTGAGETLSTYVGGAYKPSGAACAVGQGSAPPPKKQECVGVPGQTMCKRDDGKLCATATTGKQICWSPGETGEKGDGPLLQVRNAGSTPAAPQTPPPAGDSLTQQGSPQQASESINGGSPIVTVITNYVTSTGVNAVGGSSGSATGGSGDAGEPDDGSQGGGGSGSGNDPGGVGSGVGSLYTKGTDTVDSVWTAFKARIEAAPIMSASTSFLTFSGSASCPTWTVPATAYWPVMTATFLCEGPLADNLALAGYLALALAAYAAFKIGVL